MPAGASPPKNPNERKRIMDRLNVAVIGCGSHAESHFREIADEPRLRLQAIAEINPERLQAAAAKHKPNHAFSDYREMLDKAEIDIVYVVTVPGHLLPIVLDCLDRDVHVSVEKSPGMSSDETLQMVDAERKSKAKAIVSFNRRYFPEVLAVRRLVQQQGGAVHCAATYNKPLTAIGTPRTQELFPDPLICDSIHLVDLLRWLSGPNDSAAHATEVYSEVQDGDRPGAHRNNAVIKFDSGSFGAMMSHYGIGYRIQRAEVHAEDTSAYFELTRGTHYDLYRAHPAENDTTAGALIEEPLDLEPVGGSGFNETQHFVDCILEDRTPWSSLEDSVHTMKLCEAIRNGHKGAI